MADNEVDLNVTLNKESIALTKEKNRIEWARTVSKNFQGCRFGISVNYPVDTVKLSQARDLAEFLVKVQITHSWTGVEILKHQEVYQLCFLEPIHAFLDPLKESKELNG